jgi:hypothetical protein
MARFGKFPVIKFQPGNEAGIYTDTNNKWQKFAKSICLMKFKNECEPIPGIIRDHAAVVCSKISIRMVILK